MMVFEVRHWITNHEAGIGEGGKAATRWAQFFMAPRGTSRFGMKIMDATRAFLGRNSSPGPRAVASATTGRTSSPRFAAGTSPS